MIPINLRNWLLAAVIVAILTIVSYEVLDQPLSYFSHDQLHRYAFFKRLTTLTEYFPPLAIVVVVLLALLRLGNYSLGYRLEALLMASVSLIIARAIKDQLKFVFGRTWPETWTNNNPSLIKDGAYGFHPFHSGLGYESFPSGHMVAICSVAMVLWIYYPRLWPIYLAVIVLVAGGLIGADYHFLSDILAGGFIGSSVALFCCVLFGQISSQFQGGSKQP